ncbi:MAG: hypothetical protein J6Y13_05435, partial [Treponema sp.]|nr:hypothetical protein [Treponema sp.]
MEDGWHGGSSTTPSTVDDTGKTASAAATSQDVGMYGSLTDALLEALKTSTANSASKGETTKTNIENGTNTSVVNPDTSASLRGWPEDVSESELQKLTELLNNVVKSQNEVNTISQVVSTSEKYYEIG